MKRILSLILLSILSINLVYAQEPSIILDTVNVRTIPGGSLITLAPIHAEIIVEARNNSGDWLLIHTIDNAIRGWVSSQYVQLGSDVYLMQLPVSVEHITQTTSTETANPDSIPEQQEIGAETPQLLSISGAEQDLITQLSNVPIIPTMTNNVRRIYQYGQESGNNPTVFTIAGDGNAASGAYLWLIGMGQYDLGQYGNLQATIDFFSTPFNSFAHESLTAVGNYSSLTILDPANANNGMCRAGQNLLNCEFDLVRPGVILINFVIKDIHVNPHDWQQHLTEIITTSINRGVIPVLFTFPVSPAASPQLRYDILQANLTIVNLGRQFNIPVVNLWKATQDLPDGGMHEDVIHLAYSGEPFIHFTGDQSQWGYTQWNLVTLQTLEALRESVSQR